MGKSIVWAVACLVVAVGFVACGGGGGGSSTAKYTISGTVTNNTSNQSNPIQIGYCRNADMSDCGGTGVSGGHVVSYTIPDVPAGTYYLGACVEVDNIAGCTSGDPRVQYASNPVTVNADVTGINITIN